MEDRQRLHLCVLLAPASLTGLFTVALPLLCWAAAILGPRRLSFPLSQSLSDVLSMSLFGFLSSTEGAELLLASTVGFRDRGFWIGVNTSDQQYPKTNTFGNPQNKPNWGLWVNGVDRCSQSSTVPGSPGGRAGTPAVLVSECAVHCRGLLLGWPVVGRFVWLVVWAPQGLPAGGTGSSLH